MYFKFHQFIQFMRNFVCKASKAMFFADLDFTYNFRNDCIEFIVKEDRGVYGVAQPDSLR